VRVVIAEDEALLREGLARLLADAGLDVASSVGDPAGLLRAVVSYEPDVAIVDIRMPPTHTDEGLVAAAEIHRAHPGTGVLVLSHHVDSAYAMRLLQEAPQRAGYLLKDRVADVSALLDAVHRVAAGGRSTSCRAASSRSWRSSPKGAPTRRSATGCSSRRRRWRATSGRSSSSWASGTRRRITGASSPC